MINNINNYNSWYIYQHTREIQKKKVYSWCAENIITCSKKEGALLDIMYKDFCDRNNIQTNKLTKLTFAKYLCLYLKERDFNYKIINKSIKKLIKRFYLGITIPVLK